MNKELFHGKKVLSVSEKGYFIIIDTFNVGQAYSQLPTVGNMTDRIVCCDSEKNIIACEQEISDIAKVEDVKRDSDISTNTSVTTQDVPVTTELDSTENGIVTEVISFEL